MCIRFCDDGNPAACPIAVEMARLSSFDELAKFLEYRPSELDGVLDGIDRYDTLEYLLWYPALWMTEVEWDVFVKNFDHCCDAKDFRYKSSRG